ncbi:hypothetical protein CIPAW_16G047400 [Carya illinoinensis]|uniref:Calcineurin-like phosphoesterase domain-containing protein n=1 Tax=Carya illinoinensis TaxID=32201 RepID=A0A8T1N5L3_CARIL|nr:hypothetical protein CIPAW_16G047400 [Carya illinoinensis]
MHALYSLWATFIGLYIANCIAERLTASGEEYEKNKIMKPDFLEMVPWYSGTSVDLYKTVFNIVVSVNFFLGRFDMRVLQAAAMNRVGGRVPKNRRKGQDDDGDFLYELHGEKKELWFDFMADTGDGGNSTYTVARLLAQPRIELGKHTLNRGELLLIGGDIAYPNPSQYTYESRLFRPFEYALQSRSCAGQGSCAEQARMAVDKPKAPPEVSDPSKQGRKRSKKHPPKQVKPYEGPRCFLIPGNHDWFDGLHNFMGHICHRSWLGGWFMPQRKSYFALKLPKGWWLFGLDLALHGDIDVYQFQFFSKLARKRVGERDSVIVMTHQPDWLLDWYEDGDQHNYKHNISDLICNILKRKCRLRIAGDIHHYMRHERVNSGGGSDELIYPQHLLVNGCGGAFLHPTHVFRNFSKSHGVSYECKQAYPTFEKSRKCELGTVWSAFMYMVHHSYVSLGGSVLFLMASIAFTPSKRSWTTRIVIGFCHFSAHLVVDLILLWLFELGVETFVQIGLLESSEYHSLYRSLESMLIQTASNGNRTSLEQWTFGLYPACIKYVMTAFDVPEVPEDWQLDPQWKQESEELRQRREFGEQEYPEELSYRREFPSKWRAAASYQDPLDTVRIIDHFVIRQQNIRPNS